MIVVHRQHTPDDRDFIVSSWSSSFKRSHFAGMIHTDDWAAVMHPQIRRVLERPDARAMVAYEKTDPAFLYGFIAGDTSLHVPVVEDGQRKVYTLPVVFYVFVKEAYRRVGIARGLFTALGVDPLRPFIYTGRTGVVRTLIEARKIPRADWNPLVARYEKQRS
jgi:GNAT superfamily N-acetyltransferase